MPARKSPRRLKIHPIVAWIAGESPHAFCA
jgi:hypothetical protein